MFNVDSGAKGASDYSRILSPDSLSDFFENGSVALHLVDASGSILYANRAELALLGYPRESYVGRSIRDFHADAEVIEDILFRLTSGETLRSYPARLKARDGSIRYVEISSSGNFENGRFVNTRCFTVDVTELKLAQAEIRRKDEQMRQVLDALPAAIYTTDQRGLITYFNKAAAELAGREPVLGRDHWCVTYKLFTSDGTPLPHDECPMAIALKEGRAVRGVEAMAQRPDGSLFPFIPFPTPLTNDDGQLAGAVNMLVDISERKEAEARQRLLLNELNHRVKNNMQMLHGLLQMAHRETGSPEARKVLADAAQRVSAIAAAQKLLYAETSPRTFECQTFVEAVCTSAQQAFPPEVKIEVEVESCDLPNDAAMPLALILNELLTNAVKYGVGSDGSIQVLVSLQREDGEFILCVRDKGLGFDPSIASSKRASGLGLVRGLAQQLGGDFAVESSAGAKCTLRFPAAQDV